MCHNSDSSCFDIVITHEERRLRGLLQFQAMTPLYSRRGNPRTASARSRESPREQWRAPNLKGLEGGTAPSSLRPGVTVRALIELTNLKPKSISGVADGGPGLARQLVARRGASDS